MQGHFSLLNFGLGFVFFQMLYLKEFHLFYPYLQVPSVRGRVWQYQSDLAGWIVDTGTGWF